FDGPVAGVRVGIKDGKPQAFLASEELDNGKLDLVIAGTKDAIMMVEAGANEVSEEEVVEALTYGHKAIQPAIALQQELAKKLEVKPMEYELALPDGDIQQRVETWLSGRLGAGLRRPYPERNDLVAQLRDEMHAHFEEEIGEGYAELKAEYSDAFQMAMHKDVRKGIVEEQIRPDGRKLTEIRPLSSEIGILPRAHGSSLFTRGVTQAMNIV